MNYSSNYTGLHFLLDFNYFRYEIFNIFQDPVEYDQRVLFAYYNRHGFIV